ncbi:MAG: hypothetical protein ACM3O3_12675 [Syntrophothermus sp.]
MSLIRKISYEDNLFAEANPGISKLIDGYSWKVEFTPMDEMRVVIPYKLCGTTFAGNTLDSNFWTSSTANGGLYTHGNSQLILTTGTTPSSSSTIESVRYARYTAGSSLRYRSVIRLPDTGTANNTRRWGAFNATDGCFFELSGTTFRIVTRKSGVDTQVNNGSFNGYTATYTVNTNVQTYEIYWTNSKVYFIVSGELLHTVSATTTTWSDSISLPIRAENSNNVSGSSSVGLNIRTSAIHKLGAEQSQPTSKYQSGTTAGVVYKYGTGNLHGLVVSNVSNNSVVTLYDNTSATGTIIWSSGTMGAITTPFQIDFFNLPFSNGLTLVISTANCNVTTIYE